MSDGKISRSEACDAAAKRLLRANASILLAFWDLGLGWGIEDVRTLAEGTELCREMPEELLFQFLGAMMAFGIVCVEREREAPGL